MPASLKLPLQFDPALLARDLAAAEAYVKWIAHFNKGYYDGDWSGIPLRTTAGAHSPLYPDPTVNEYDNLPVLDQCPYFQHAVRSFECPIRTVRLLRLGGGAVIKEHRDYGLEYEEGEARVHIPVRTNPDVVFMLDGQRLVLAEGEAWYLNVNLPHSVRNDGLADRVHLVIDCVVNDWLREIFERE